MWVEGKREKREEAGAARSIVTGMGSKWRGGGGGGGGGGREDTVKVNLVHGGGGGGDGKVGMETSTIDHFQPQPPHITLILKTQPILPTGKFPVSHASLHVFSCSLTLQGRVL